MSIDPFVTRWKICYPISFVHSDSETIIIITPWIGESEDHALLDICQLCTTCTSCQLGARWERGIITYQRYSIRNSERHAVPTVLSRWRIHDENHAMCQRGRQPGRFSRKKRTTADSVDVKKRWAGGGQVDTRYLGYAHCRPGEASLHLTIALMDGGKIEFHWSVAFDLIQLVDGEVNWANRWDRISWECVIPLLTLNIVALTTYHRSS